MENKKYQSYINNFRRRLTRLFRPGIGLLCNVYPSTDGGAILEFSFGEAIGNDDIYNEASESLGLALSNIEQRAFGGNLAAFNFKGTNTILESNRVIFIKESDPKEWSDDAAQKDVEGVIGTSKRGPK